jgi:hypothetical protein
VTVLGLERPTLRDIENAIPIRYKYSSLYVEYLKRPQDCTTTNAFYRKTMPLLRKPLPRTAHPSETVALLLIHKRHGGIIILLGLVTVIGSFIFGLVWSKYKDPTIGWAVGLPGGAIIIGYLTLLVMVYQQ